MSQAGSLTGGGSVLPDVETLTGDAGGAVGPDGAFNINLLGGNNITTTGNPGANSISFAVTGTTNHALQVGNATGSLTSLAAAINGQIPIGSTGGDPVIATLTEGIGITITNGAGSITIAQDDTLQGTATTVGAVTADVITFALGGSAAVYVFEGRIAGFNTTDVAGGGYFLIAAVRTDGAAATEIASEVTDDLEEANMAAADIAFVTSGNNIILRVTGIAAKTINWSAEMEYRSVS